MGSWRKYLLKHQSISWILILSLVLQFLIQLQIHAHHVDHSSLSSGNEHIIDYHVITDNHDSDEHSGHEGTHELKSTPYFILKKTLDRDFNFSQIVFILTFVIIPQVAGNNFWLFPDNQIIRNLYYGLSPPTRGPPSL